MKTSIQILVFFFLLSSFATVGLKNEMENEWGQTGHRVIGEIAMHYLTPKARKKIQKMLGGRSLASIGTFADEIRSDKSHKNYAPWHYVSIPSSVSYAESDKNPKGDIIQAIRKCITILEDENKTISNKSLYLKLLIHFIEDIHQPLHIGRKEDKGGNTISLKWFGKKTNLHRLWDSDMINHYGMSYTELAKDLPKLSKKEIKKIRDTDLMQWVEESHKEVGEIYANVNEGDKLDYTYQYENFDLVKLKLLKAGIRLADTLNKLFS